MANPSASQPDPLNTRDYMVASATVKYDARWIVKLYNGRHVATTAEILAAFNLEGPLEPEDEFVSLSCFGVSLGLLANAPR